MAGRAAGRGGSEAQRLGEATAPRVRPAGRAPRLTSLFAGKAGAGPCPAKRAGTVLGQPGGQHRVTWLTGPAEGHRVLLRATGSAEGEGPLLSPVSSCVGCCLGVLTPDPWLEGHGGVLYTQMRGWRCLGWHQDPRYPELNIVARGRSGQGALGLSSPSKPGARRRRSCWGWLNPGCPALPAQARGPLPPHPSTLALRLGTALPSLVVVVEQSFGLRCFCAAFTVLSEVVMEAFTVAVVIETQRAFFSYPPAPFFKPKQGWVPPHPVISVPVQLKTCLAPIPRLQRCHPRSWCLYPVLPFVPTVFP